MDGCLNAPFELPEISFVAGDYQHLSFDVFVGDGKITPDLSSYSAELCITDFYSAGNTIVLQKELQINTAEASIILELSESETLYLSGCYIYQISVRSPTDNIRCETKQGKMNIFKNATVSTTPSGGGGGGDPGDYEWEWEPF